MGYPVGTKLEVTIGREPVIGRIGLEDPLLTQALTSRVAMAAPIGVDFADDPSFSRTHHPCFRISLALGTSSMGPFPALVRTGRARLSPSLELLGALLSGVGDTSNGGPRLIQPCHFALGRVPFVVSIL